MPISIAENKDCMDAMREFPDKFFDLAIVDPPYGIGQDGRKSHTRGTKKFPGKDFRGFTEFDDEAPGPEYFEELFRVSENQIIWGANHFISRIPYDSSCWIVWDKNNGTRDFADCELAWTSFSRAVRKFTFTWDGYRQGQSFENGKSVIGDKSKNQIRIHPNEKPFALYRWLLDKFAKPGQKILDTHLGSGSHRVMAYKMGFDFWGYEKAPDFFTAQEKRFKEMTTDPISDIIEKAKQQQTIHIPT